MKKDEERRIRRAMRSDLKGIARSHRGMARVIRDFRDASTDYFIPKEEARNLYEQGKLAIDVTNSKHNETVYCTRYGRTKNDF